MHKIPYEAVQAAEEAAPSPRAQALEEIIRELKEAERKIFSWSGSAFVANELEGAEDADCKSELYGDLCKLGNVMYWLQTQVSAVSQPASFQDRVKPWMMACFGEEISNDKLERCDRFIEEALELVQAIGYSPDRAHALVEYVFNRDIGEPHQEVGGVMVTLAALCLAAGLDMNKAGEDELARIWTKVDKIRTKQAAKPTGSALPVAISQPVADGWKEVPAEATQELLADTTKGKQVLAYENGHYYNAWIEFEPSEGGYLWVDETDSEPNPTHYRPLPTSPEATHPTGGSNHDE